METLEKSLWAKTRDGDLKAFESLFNSYYNGLRLYAFDILRNKEDAEEIALDVFCTIWEKRAGIEIQSSLKSYLFRSVHNHCINFIKHKNAILKKNTDYFSSSESFKKTGLVFITEEFAIENLIATELEDKVQKVLLNLPKQCREVFFLSRYEQLKIKEIAQRLNISESTVKTQLMRAVEKLRILLIEFL